MSNTYDPWATSTGLWQECDAEIRDAHFGYDAGYNNGDSTLLILDIVSDDPDVGEGGVDTLLIPVGKGWEPKDKGATVVHESGKPRNVNKSTGLGILIESVKAHEDVAAVVAAKGSPYESETWKGLNVTLTRVQESATINGEERTFNRIHITGLAGGTTAPAKAESKAETATDTKADAGTGSAVPKALEVKLKRAAKAAEDWDDFVTKAMEIDGADQDPAASLILDDASYYESLLG